MGQYLKNSITDFVLCTCITLALVSAICSGFVLTDKLSGSVIAVLALSAVLTFVLVLLSRSRKTALLGVAAAFVLVVIGLVYINMTHPFTDETANSTFIFALVQVITAILVWLLTRSRPGTAALFLIGTVLCAGAHFLQFPIPVWSLFLFLVAVSVSFLWRVCIVSVQKADIVSGSRKSFFLQSCIAAVIALLLAGGVFFGIVRPLDPPALELRLVTELRSMELMQILGVSSTEIILDPDMTADVPPEETELGSESGQKESDALDGQDQERSNEMPDFNDVKENISSALQQAASAVRYDSFEPTWLWLLLLIPLAVAGAYVLRYFLKKRWRSRIRALSRRDAVVNYYRFFLSRLGRIGLKKRPDCTLREFAGSIKVQTQPFEANGISFEKLTTVYEKVFYGRCSVSEEEYRSFEAFYDSFFRCLRRETGTVKYYLTAFRY
ncbi:MAG: DUF4129 domain-containing protein [Oscillospiraceae bacterium]